MKERLSGSLKDFVFIFYFYLFYSFLRFLIFFPPFLVRLLFFYFVLQTYFLLEFGFFLARGCSDSATKDHWNLYNLPSTILWHRPARCQSTRLPTSIYFDAPLRKATAQW